MIPYTPHTRQGLTTDETDTLDLESVSNTFSPPWQPTMYALLEAAEEHMISALPPTARPSPYRICIDGLIGAGKTTVMEYLRQHLPTSECHIMDEPIHHWDCLLELLYATKEQQMDCRHAVAALLQIAVLNGYCCETPSAQAAPYVIMERSPWSSLSVFLEAQALPSELEQIVLDAAHNLQPKLETSMPTAIIFLKASPGQCLQRIHKRHRLGEEGIDLQYLETLESCYNKALDNFSGPYVTINADAHPAAVACQVLQAVQLLSRRHYNPPINHSGVDQSHIRPLVPTTQLEALSLAQPKEDMTNNKSDKLTPSLTCREALSPATPDCQQTTCQRSNPEDPVLTTSKLSYERTPLSHLYQAETEVPVLFSAYGHFQFSYEFKQSFIEKYNYQPDIRSRSSSHVLRLFAELGPEASSAPGCCIEMAIVPAKAATTLKIQCISKTGAEAIFIDTEAYAQQRCEELLKGLPEGTLLEKLEEDFCWRQGYKNEAYILDGWIRHVRLRPLLNSGVQPFTPVCLSHTPMPLAQELEVPTASNAILPHAKGMRLVSNLPPPGNRPDDKPLDHLEETLDTGHLYVMTGATRSSRRRLNQPHRAPAEPADRSVSPNLACTVCGDPDKAEVMLLCSGPCNRGFHTYCVNLDQVPSTEWYCEDCQMADQQSPTSSDYSPSGGEDDDSNNTEQAVAAGNSKRHAKPGVPVKTATPAPKPASNIRNTTPGRLRRSPRSSDLQPHPDKIPASVEDADTESAGYNAADDDVSEDNDDDNDNAPGNNTDIHLDEACMHYLRTGTHCVTKMTETAHTSKKAMASELKRIRKRAANYRYDEPTKRLMRLPTSKYPDEREVLAIGDRP